MTCPHCGEQNQDETGSCFHCGQPLQQVTSVRRGSVVSSRYEILEPLGRGGMGMVYRAHDRTLDEEVALKVLRSEVARDADMARRFRQEIKLARKVRHANVCGIHEYGEDGDLRFIAMEFIRGVDLRQVLERRGALPAGEAFAVAIQIADGLDAIHEAGIIHRDLKTPNIMVDDRGRIRLMDFGIAKLANREATLGATAFGVVVGTPEYMSPEQARGEKVDFRSDVYALGIVIFELFTGQVPFRGETPIATIFKHMQEEPPLRGPRAAALPAALVPILARALAKRSADRQADVRVVSDELKAARATVPEGRALPPVIRSATLELPLVDASLETQPTPVPSRVPTEVRAVVPDETARAGRVEEERLAQEAAARAAEEARALQAREAQEARRREEEAAALAAAEARRAEAARQSAEARRVEDARRREEARRVEEARKAEAAARKAEAARQAEEARRVEAERKAERARAAEAEKQASRARAEERKRAAAAARAQARAERGTASAAGRGPMIAVIAAGCVLAIALVVWLAWPRPVPPTDPTATVPVVDPVEPATPSPAPPTGAGTLVIDAVPWGEVVAVVDGSGRSLALEAARSTPFLVALPVGPYTVSVRGPDGRETKSVAVSLGASATESRIVEFRRVDARAYFRRAGFADAR
jgi:Protein kinase domain